MSTKPETGTILFEVALLTIVVLLVDEWLIRGALAFIPAMLLAQRALDTANVSEGGHGNSASIKGPTDKLLGVFREFYSMCHLLGSGGITPDEAHQRTLALEKEVNLLMGEVKSVTQPMLESQEHFGAVGAFEGGGYQAKGIYRPEVDCIMFTRNPTSFCRVCTRGIERVIDLYSE